MTISVTNREDVAVLRELAGSVYLTPRQRLALGRLLARAELGAPMIAGVALSGGGTPEEETQRRALLGPCGVE